MAESGFFGYFTIGLLAGVASGLFGVGGGIIIVPALVFLYSYSQQEANGTSLVALLLPVGIFAVLNYWKSEKINLQNVYAGLTIGLGIALGAIFGSRIAIGIDESILKKCFAVLLVIIAGKMWF